MSNKIGSSDCVYCHKVKSGYWRMADGWLCSECYAQIYWGVRKYAKTGVRSSHRVEYNKRLTVAELDRCFECLKKGRKLREGSVPTIRSSDGKLLADTDKNLIYLGENVWNPLDEKYISPAHPIENISAYYILYYSEVISWSDNAIKNAYLMIEFQNQPLQYERIPLGKPKGFFNINRRYHYRRKAREYFDIMQTVTGKLPGKGQTIVYKP